MKISQNPQWTGNGQLSNGESYSGYTWTNDFGGRKETADGRQVH